MSKAVPFLLALMLLYSLCAEAVVQSNSIGQDRDGFAQESEYTLSIQGDVSTLYHFGEPVWKRTMTPWEDGYEVSTFQFDEETTHYRLYGQDRLVAEELGSGVRYFYYDARGILEKTMVVGDGKVREMEIYTYDAATNSLNSLLLITEEGSSILYFGDPQVRPWFTYTKGDAFTKVMQISETLQVQEVWQGDSILKSVEVEMEESGGIRVKTVVNGLEQSELYNELGLLVLKTSPSLRTEYRYDDRTLLEEVEGNEEGKKRIIRYEGGNKVTESHYQDDILEKDVSFPAGSGKVETLYDKGKPYCDITYALDGERVLSIRYR